MPCRRPPFFRTCTFAIALGLAFFGLEQSSHRLNSYGYTTYNTYMTSSIPISQEKIRSSSVSSNTNTNHSSSSDRHHRPHVVGLQWKEGRDYSSHPITAAESEYLDHQKQQLPAEYSEISTAICHRTLHGNLNMDKVFSFVSYYRLLGFDHIFFWYRPGIAELPRFDELQALPYVTLTEYTGQGVHHGQTVVESKCLTRPEFAANYTWAFPIDLDEYLWYTWREPIYNYIVNRLANLSYVSIGKYMYTQRHAVTLERNDSGFGLDRFAFTAGSYCYGFAGMYACPGWRGRAKVLVKPSVHKCVNIHGCNDSQSKPGGTHLLSPDIHLKEWPTYLTYSSSNFNTTVRPDRIPFYVSRADEVDTHFTMEGHAKTEGGLVPLWYDESLQDWFRFVAQGCPRDYQSISQH